MGNSEGNKREQGFRGSWASVVERLGMSTQRHKVNQLISYKGGTIGEEKRGIEPLAMNQREEEEGEQR